MSSHMQNGRSNQKTRLAYKLYHCEVDHDQTRPEDWDVSIHPLLGHKAWASVRGDLRLEIAEHEVDDILTLMDTNMALEHQHEYESLYD